MSESEERITLRWGIKEWAAVVVASCGTVAAAYTMRSEVKELIDANFRALSGQIGTVTKELVQLNSTMESHLALELHINESQDKRLEQFEGRQIDARERLGILESEVKRGAEQ